MPASDAYAQQAAATASPAQLVLMLYDGALARVHGARVALSRDPIDVEAVHTALGKAQAILTELAVTLDHDRGGVIASQLASVYAYCSQRLVAANVRKELAPLVEVDTLLASLRDAWSQACMPRSAVVS